MKPRPTLRTQMAALLDNALDGNLSVLTSKPPVLAAATA
jgi:hypothetical protein